MLNNFKNNGNDEINDNDEDEYNEDEYTEINETTESNLVKCKLYEKNNKFIAIISKSSGVKGEIFIKAYVDYNQHKYDIVKIGNNAFSGAKINSISFADNSAIKIISESAFDNSEITSIYIPKSLIKTSNSMFKGASKLEKIIVDNFINSS